MANYIVKIHPTLGIAVRSDGYVVVKRFNTMHSWTTGTTAVDGYKVVKIGGKQYKVHRLIAEAFIPNPHEKPTVDHINRVRDDNRIENLRWATYREQMDNSSTIINRIDYGFRSCDDRTGYDRMRSRARREANPKAYSTYQKEYRRSKKSMGMIEHKCPDGHRRWHKPGECPVCHRHNTLSLCYFQCGIMSRNFSNRLFQWSRVF